MPSGYPGTSSKATSKCETCGFLAEHVMVAEKALGRRLKKGELVHHIDGDGQNNQNSNLLICSTGYHTRLHGRMSYLYQRERFGTV